jgi:hypothetical protein
MRRAPRANAKYCQAQPIMTLSRFRKPIRYAMWISHQIHQARKPVTSKRPIVPTAAARPIVAREPLST